jgi:Fe-S cluster assembly protein SufD
LAELAESAVRGPAWLAARRERAAELRGSLDLPRHKGQAGWEFTELGKSFALDAFPPVAAGEGDAMGAADVEHLLEVPEDAIELVQVDGRAAVEPDTQPTSSAGTGAPADGVVVLPLTLAVERHPELVEPHLGQVVSLEGSDVFVAANDADWTGGAFVHVPRGVKVDAPILLTAITATANTSLQRRVLIVLDEGAEAEVWEQYLSGDAENESMLNTVVELRVGQNARLRYVCGQDLNEKSWIFGAQRAEVARDGSLDWVALGFGGARGHVRMETSLDGPGAHAKVTGAYAPHGRQHVDFDTTQEHAAPNCVSDLAFRGILADRSSAVWRGVIKVDKDAQQTDGFQECRNLLLSKRAHSDAIPGLEILANDVRCTHAAAVAQIDQEQLFYLRSRGLAEGPARRLVIEGFLAELVERFEEGPFREAMAATIERRLELVLG